MSLAILTLALAGGMLGGNFDEEAPPFDWTRPTKGGRYLFVMLRPKEWRRYDTSHYAYTDSFTNRQKWVDRNLSKIYPCSGLYRNGETKKPIWKVDWYSFDAWASSDGLSLVRWGPWPRYDDKGKTLAMAFYRGGELVKKYEVAELVPDFEQLPRSVSHYQWCAKRTFDDAGKRVKVTFFRTDGTYEPGRSAIFRIDSGEVTFLTPNL